ncbi:MAG: M20/M25/M40 family metallo-hydrolase [Anaerolineaceae bacterium]|nr:M20/M25/M40 family metallo-hydrolase [Anaerolineaceae bacterium]
MKTLVQHFAQDTHWNWLPAAALATIEQAVAIQQIPAPTFEEGERAAYIAAQFRALGLCDIQTDAVHNVWGRLPGKRDDVPGVLISAHTDTVFAADTDLAIRREKELIYGPGLGDNCMGVAGLLALAGAFQAQRWTPDCDLWFLANSREEGLGDLGGMKAAFAALRDRIALVINLEGMAFGHVYRAGIAVRRLHITANTDGGHSWLHFGRPSAIHGIVRLGAAIASIHPAHTPRTTYNIGMIDGGQTINAIATHASLWLDLRSEAPQALAALENEVRGYVQGLSTPDLRLSVEVVGDRPAGAIADDHPLLLGALAALEQVGVHGTLEVGSTDANVPLAAGYPAVTIGITRGGNAHRLDEYIETEPTATGLRQLVLLTLAAAAHQAGRMV